MIVVDASAVLDLLLRTGEAERIAERALRPEESLHAPHLLDVEVAQVVRRHWLSGKLSASRAEAALTYLRVFPIRRHPHDPLLPRIWELRHHLTAYDAAYVALAEALDAPLLTRDRRMASAPGHTARIELV